MFSSRVEACSYLERFEDPSFEFVWRLDTWIIPWHASKESNDRACHFRCNLLGLIALLKLCYM